MTYSDSVEKIVDKFISQRIKELSPLDVDAYFAARGIRLPDPKIDIINGNLQRIYGSISALLTHISAMIAALGIILIVFDDSTMTQCFIFLEMIIYTILAIVCVFLLRFRTITPDEAKLKINNYYYVYLRKRYMYHYCCDGVLINTLLFLITILAHSIALITFN